MKREKKLTKKERKAIERATAPAQAHHDHAHIHCIVCGRHLDPHEFDDPATATVVTCLHKSDFPCCVGCTSKAQELLAEHDRTGEPVKTANAWH